MILAVTLNPCIDMTLFVRSLAIGGHNVAERARRDVSGKGINVNVALRNLGVPTKTVGFEFSHEGAPIADFLGQLGIPFSAVSVDASLRVNTKVFDADSAVMTEINCRGPQLSGPDVEAFLRIFEDSLPGTDILVVDGSVPPGIPPDIYRRMIEMARKKGVRTVLDASGKLLENGLLAKPDLVKPNKAELEALLRKRLDSLDAALAACRLLVERGIGSVCLSLGKEGALLVSGSGAWFSPGLDIRVQSFQGAGDSMVAGLCLAMLARQDGADLLRSGVAAAHGTLLREGTLMCTREAYDELYGRIPVSVL